MKPKKTIALSDIAGIIRYSPEDGRFFRKTDGRWREIAKGVSGAGKARPYGYRTIYFDGAQYYAHRVAWLLMTGECPAGSLIDHKNRDTLDNRWENLRKADKSQNGANKKISKRNTVGVKGVYPTENGKFGARLKKNGKMISLGRFRTIENAADAYRAAAAIFHGEFSTQE